MNNLPIAAYLATELVERQLRDGTPDRPARPVRLSRRPVFQARVALAEALDRVARSVAPSGYHLAH